MGVRLTDVLRAPRLQNEEETRVAQLINGTLLVCGLSAAIYFLLTVFFDVSTFRPLIRTLSLVMLLCIAMLKVLLHQGYLRLVATLLSIAVWTAFTIPLVTLDGIRDTALVGYFVAVLITALTLGYRSLILVDVLASLSLIFVYRLEVRGVLVTGLPTPPNLVDLVSELLALNATAGLAGFAVHRLAVAERRRSRERDRAQQYLDVAGAIIIALDAEGRITLVNERGREVLGCPEDGIIGLDWFTTFVPESERAAARASWQALLACGLSPASYLEMPILTCAGDERMVAWRHTALYDEVGTCVGTLSSGEDITLRRQAEETLKRSYDRLVTVLDSIEADVYVADMISYEILFMNKHMRASFGDDLVGQICYQVFRDQASACLHCTNSQLLDGEGRPGGIVTWEGYNPLTDRWYVNHDRAITWVDGRLARVQVATDITEHRRAEEARDHSQALLLALSQAAQAVQRARTPEAVYRAIGDQASVLDLYAFVFEVEDGRRRADLVYTTLPPDLLRHVENAMGQSVAGLSLPLEPGSTLHAAFRGMTRFDPLTVDIMVEVVPEGREEEASALLAHLGEQRRIIAPMMVDGRVHALLAFLGPTLSQRDVPAVTAFANQAAIAVENARLYREMQRLADFNELIIASMVEGLAVQNLEGVVTFANPAAEQLLGYEPGGLVGVHGTDFIPPDQQPKVRAADERRARGEADHYSLELMRTDGRRFSALVSGTPLQGEDGQFVGTLAVFADVTQQVQAQAAVAASERRVRELFQAVPVCCFTFDREGVIGEWNRACESFYGWSSEEAIGTSMFDLMVREENAATTRENLAALFKGASFEDLEFVDRRADGSLCTVLAYEYGLRDQEDRVVSAICAELDITERKRAEEQLVALAQQVQAQASQLTQILATVPVGVLLIDAQGSVIEANPPARADLETLAGVSVGDRLTHLGDRPLRELLTSPPSGEVWHEVMLDDRIFESLARPVEQGAAPEHWVLVVSDVTRERKIQEELGQQERLAAVGQLAAGIAHDFNNILATIVLYAKMAARAPELTAATRERIGVIDQQAWHATRLIEQILDFSRRSVLTRQSVDMLALLLEQVDLWSRTLPESIRIELEHGDDDYTVDADPTRMRQMFMNLALNARDAMAQGGLLRVALTRLDSDDSSGAIAGSQLGGQVVRLAVSDTGEGIPASALPHIFEPFFTTKEPGKGSGLGLAQVHGIVGQHGGHISVSSAVGKGTTFTVDLPAHSTSPLLPTGSEGSRLSMGQGQTILIVEDNAALREAIADIVSQFNYRAIEAANGREALVVLTEHPEVDLVLTDLVMPEMGGQALFYALRERRFDTPVAIITGHPLDEAMGKLQAEGIVGWLQKPLDLGELAQLLAEGVAMSDRGTPPEGNA